MVALARELAARNEDTDLSKQLLVLHKLKPDEDGLTILKVRYVLHLTGAFFKTFKLQAKSEADFQKKFNPLDVLPHALPLHNCQNWKIHVKQHRITLTLQGSILEKTYAKTQLSLRVPSPQIIFLHRPRLSESVRRKITTRISRLERSLDNSLLAYFSPSEALYKGLQAVPREPSSRHRTGNTPGSNTIIKVTASVKVEEALEWDKIKAEPIGKVALADFLPHKENIGHLAKL